MVAVLLGLIVGFLWSQRILVSNAEERDDLDLFLEASSAGWAQVTRQFFEAPESAAQTVSALAPEMETSEQRILLLAEAIRTSNDLGAAFVGFADGSFTFVARSDKVEVGGFRTRTISFPDGERMVELTWTDRDLKPVLAEIDNDDAYDPRARPWFEPINEGERTHWTEPYIFASSQEPGITHSAGMYSATGELQAVVGVDISLSKLSAFLDELSPEANGEALVIDSHGRAIAMSAEPFGSTADMVGPDSNRMDQLDNPEAILAAGGVRRSPNGEHTTVVRPTGSNDDWYLAVRALDADFISNQSASNVFETVAVGLAVASLSAFIGLTSLGYLFGLKEEAEVDELTGVLTRRAAKRELHTVLNRAKGPVQVAILDLDNFKQVNDHHGHHAGDQVLSVMAERLRVFADSSDAVVGRLGGDEFMVFGESRPAWDQLVLDLRNPIVFEDETHLLSASIGVATSLPGDEDDIDELLRAADRALFQVKRRGGSSVLSGAT